MTTRPQASRDRMTEAAQELIQAHIDGYQAATRAWEENSDAHMRAALRSLGDVHRDLAIEHQIEMRIRHEKPEESGSWIALGRQWWTDLVGGLTAELDSKLVDNVRTTTVKALDLYAQALAAPLTPSAWETRRDRLESVLDVLTEVHVTR